MSIALLSNQGPGKRIRYIEDSLFYKFFIKIRQGMKELLSTSFFYNGIKKEDFTPDIYRGSIAVRYIIDPFYLWIRRNLSFSRTVPQIGLVLAIFIFSFYNPVVPSIHLAKFRLGLLLLPILLIAGMLSTELKIPHLTPLDLPLFSLLLVSIISLRTVENISALSFGLRELMSLCVFIISIYLVYYAFRKQDIKKLFYVLGLAGIGASVSFIFHTIFFQNADAYLKNTFGNPNHFGYFLLLIYPIVLAISLDNRSRSRHLWQLGLGLIIISIFFTYSLGVWIPLFLSLPLLAIGFKKKWPIICLSILIMIFILCPFIRDKFLEQITIGHGSTIMARVEIWKEALCAIYDRPILGIGLGQFSASAKPHYAKEMHNAFSVFLHLAATTGILGLILFLWFLIRIFKLNISLLKTDKIYGTAILTSLTCGVIGFFWDTHLLAVMTNWLLGIVLGSSVVMARQGG